jgi:hypothetical protein
MGTSNLTCKNVILISNLIKNSNYETAPKLIQRWHATYINMGDWASHCNMKMLNPSTDIN